jgi:hypothetical protein
LIEKEGMKETLYVIDKKFSKYNKYQIQSIDIYSCWKFALIAATLTAFIAISSTFFVLDMA